MSSIGTKTRYVQSITAKDDSHDTIILSDNDPTTAPAGPMPGLGGGQDSLVVPKPHSYVTGQPITLDYSVA